MPTTRNGLTATKTRDLPRAWTVTLSPTLAWMVELYADDTNIADIDTNDLRAPFLVTAEFTRRYRTDEGNPDPGWWVNEGGGYGSEAYPTLRDALRETKAAMVDKRRERAVAAARRTLAEVADAWSRPADERERLGEQYSTEHLRTRAINLAADQEQMANHYAELSSVNYQRRHKSTAAALRADRYWAVYEIHHEIAVAARDLYHQIKQQAPDASPAAGA